MNTRTIWIWIWSIVHSTSNIFNNSLNNNYLLHLNWFRYMVSTENTFNYRMEIQWKILIFRLVPKIRTNLKLTINIWTKNTNSNRDKLSSAHNWFGVLITWTFFLYKTSGIIIRMKWNRKSGLYYEREWC